MRIAAFHEFKLRVEINFSLQLECGIQCGGSGVSSRG